MGLLVQKKMAELEITATDSAGRKWREPPSLVKTIVRDFIYQSLVDHQIKALHESGIDLIAVPDIDKPVSIQGQAGYVALKDVRHHFHPNGYGLTCRLHRCSHLISSASFGQGMAMITSV
ncbi:hypothetical protein ACT42A_18730 (plasmid) [Acinetobacter baumannii]